MLKSWFPGFKPVLENFSKQTFWMLLPDFTLEFWSIQIFEAIANSVGKFIYFDELSLCMHNKRLIWILVELDLDRGLFEAIDITIGNTHILQANDFWKDPFRCHYYWKTGHLKSKCPASRMHSQSLEPFAIDFESIEVLGSGPFDRGSFLGKMHFFPLLFQQTFFG
jgi:hypothetical protein